MNKKTEEILLNAGYVFDPYGTPHETPRFSAELLIDLVVKECAEKAYRTSWDALTQSQPESVIPLHIHNELLKHFGVNHD